MIIRPATDLDCDRICAIWNATIGDTTATFTPVLKTRSDILDMLSAKADANQPLLVADRQGVIGFATYGAFRSGPGYREVVEHTVHLDKNAIGSGAGRALMDALHDFAKARGIRVMVAGISGENTNAIRFHTALGYTKVGHMLQVATKFGRTLDLVLMQKML